MNVGSLIKGKLIRRYKRFFVDVELENGEVVVAHTANTGAMTSCFQTGWNCLLSYTPDPKRKLKYSLQFTNNGKSWIGVNTHFINQIAKESLIKKQIKELSSYSKVTPEYTIGDSRLDFMMEDDDGNRCFIEVKNVSMVDLNGHGMFPDSVSARATKHLNELLEIKKQGHRTVVLLISQREDIKTFSPNENVDPEFSEKFKECVSAGVEFLIFNCKLEFPTIELNNKVELII